VKSSLTSPSHNENILLLERLKSLKEKK